MALDFACPDWWAKLEAGLAPLPDLDLDEAAAEKAVAIFDNLHLPDVIGRPSLGEASGEWARDLVRVIFGSLDPATGRRAAGESFVLVPKKNAKTTSSAAIAIVFLLLNQRHNADLLIIGPTQKIADIAFEQAKGMIEADPEGWLGRRFQVQDHKKTIKDRHNNSRLMVRTFGMDVLTGAKPVFCLIDEVHILGGIAYAADVIRQIRGGMLPFPEAHLLMITTQSDHPPAGVFRSELQYARGVRDGRIRDGVRLVPMLYEFPEAVQTDPRKLWADPELWRHVTPNLGHSIDLDRLVEGFKRAREDGDHELVAWATQHLNVEVGLALHVDRWTGADYWEAAVEPALTLETLLAQCDVAVAGIDGGGLDDLLGLAVIGRHKVTKRWLGWLRAWAHPIALARRPEIAPRLRDFERAGDLVICERPTQDIEEAAALCAQINAAGLLPGKGAIGLDPYGVAALVDELAAQGIADDQMVGIRQGSALSPAIWGLERKLADGTFRHAGQGLGAWVIGNARAEQRGNAIYITKATAGKAKIDPLIALFNAAFLMARNPEAEGARCTPWDADPNYKLRGRA